MVTKSFLSVALSTSLFALSSAGPIKLAPEKTNTQGDTVKLLPVREVELFPHIERRSDDFSTLQLRDEIRLIYGSDPITQHGVHLAEMKITKSDPRHPFILLEDLEHHLDDAHCAGEDLYLKFNNKQGMDTAVRSWDWVNQKNPDFFYLITHHHHKGCGPDEERTAYKIVGVKRDPASLRISLTRRNVSWDEAARTFKLRIGSVDHPSIHRRGQGKQAPIVSEQRHRAKGSHTYDWSRKNYSLWTKKLPLSKMDLTCADCSLTGDMKIEAWAERRNSSLGVDFGVDFQPGIKKAIVQLKATIDAKWEDARTPEFITLKLQPANIAIPGIGDFGLKLIATPQLVLSGEARGEVEASVQLKTGDASVSAWWDEEGPHFDYSKNNWDIAKPEFKLVKAQVVAEGNLDAVLKLGLRAGLTLNPGLLPGIKKGDLGVDFSVTAGAKNKFQAGWKHGGFCPKEKGEWGADFTSNLAIDAVAEILDSALPEAVRFIRAGFIKNMKKEWPLIKPRPLFPGETCIAYETGERPGVPSKAYPQGPIYPEGPKIRAKIVNGVDGYEIVTSSVRPPNIKATETIAYLKKHWRGQPLSVWNMEEEQFDKIFLCTTDTKNNYFVNRHIGPCEPEH
ncbi:hypothetical protein H072_9465 [Dactylellina haptotyla CBS 200.50]|uniref:DUF7029 domain-containing protein n=1 Tax=Dactylellina haptotyla (strain CBS 200.50) TaxID=1284197 RepID=S8BP10_DACHA|nr:hypothetical protein H072_9465 [Dactylellina haptotyla CBS 200.50]